MTPAGVDPPGVFIVYLRLGRAWGECGDVERSCEYFQEADTIYRVIPGVDHPFYVEDFRPLFETYMTN